MTENPTNQNDNAVDSDSFFLKCCKSVKEGALSKSDIDSLMKILSSDYKILLEQIGLLEQRIEMACEWRDKAAKDERLIRLATLPSILARNLVLTLKTEKWAKIVYEEEKDTRNDLIAEAARLVDIWVEPNAIWDGIVHFKVVSRGYISQQDFENIMSSLRMGISYYNNRR